MRITEVANGNLLERVSEDEMSWGFYEGYFHNPSGTQHRRYRVEYVMVTVPPSINPELHAFVTDMGPQELDAYPPIRIISAGTDTVGEMRQIALLTRSDHKPQLPESAFAEKAFGEKAQQELARKREAFLGRTTFGYRKTASLEQRDRG